jgi:hypothetical protein
MGEYGGLFSISLFNRNLFFLSILHLKNLVKNGGITFSTHKLMTSFTTFILKGKREGEKGEGERKKGKRPS